MKNPRHRAIHVPLLAFTVAFLATVVFGQASETAAAPRTVPSDVRTATGNPADPTYVLKANDVVRLAVFEEPDISSQTRILQTGEVVFPLIGSVPISGLSLRAATERVRALYAAEYLVDPKVTLTVDEYAQQYVSVLGAVMSPGQIVMPASGVFDIASAIAAAGGATTTADPDQISLIRPDGTTSMHSLTGIEKGNRIQLSAGDRIIVGASRYVNQSVIFVGEVTRQGPVAFPLDGKLDLVVAAARAGGFTELANPRKVSVNRGGTITIHDLKEMSSGQSDPFFLQPNDIISVPERRF